MAYPIFQNIAGTLKAAFRIGKAGPSLRQGSQDPNTANVTGLDGDLYIRQSSTPAVFQMKDSFWRNISGEGFKRTAVTSSSYTILETDHYIGVNYAGDVNLVLPPGMENKMFIIKDESGAVNNSNRRIIVSADGTETIDGSDQITIQAPYTSMTIVFGAEWHII